MAVVVVHLLSVFSKKTGDIRLSAKCLHPADPSSSHKFIHIFTNMGSSSSVYEHLVSVTGRRFRAPAFTGAYGWVELPHPKDESPSTTTINF